MEIHKLLARHASLEARARSARLAGQIALAGTALVAVLLLAERMNIEGTWFRIPRVPTSSGVATRLIGFFALSVAGLLQGLASLATVFAVAFLVRRTGAAWLRRSPARTARALDARLETDRFSAAIEARGRFRELVSAYAARPPPPDTTLAAAGPQRLGRLLTVLTVILVLLVALAPGTAPGAKGPASVAGIPAGGPQADGLVLKLYGPNRSFGPREPVMVQVVAEAAQAPAADLNLAVHLVLDGGEERETNRRLFLPAGAPGEDATSLDLRHFARGLRPGEHRAVARAGGVESNEYRFFIDAPPGGGSGAPQPRGQSKQKRNKPKGGRGPGRNPKEDQKFVLPLVRPGPKVQKLARVPIEVPGGGPAERPLNEVWPELERRREAALKRPGLSPHAKTLVREYFERLRPVK